MAGFIVYEIPLLPTPQTIGVTLGGIDYRITVIWRKVLNQPDQEGWFMDITDAGNNPIVAGIPFVTGADLLAQYGHLNIGNGGELIVQTDSNPNQVPTYLSLGSTSHLYWYPTP